MKSLKLKEYYQKYFNFNYCRDLRVIYPPNKNFTPKPKCLHSYHYTDDLGVPKKFHKFIRENKKEKGGFYYQISHYKTLNNYRTKETTYTDRLYFDFDLESGLEDIKTELKTARQSGKNRKHLEKIAINKFRDHLLNTNALQKPFQECMILKNHLKKQGIPSLAIFSGSKGLALNILLDESLPLKNISQISYKIATKYQKELGLTTLDLAVNKDASKRMQRLPYSIHNNTCLRNQPLPENLSFNEFLDIISNKNPEIIDLEIKPNNNLKKELLKQDKTIKHDIQLTKPKKTFKTSIKYTGEDLRTIAKQVLGEPVKEFREYNTYCCPFHHDEIASARIYKGNFICAGCGKWVHADNFLKELSDIK